MDRSSEFALERALEEVATECSPPDLSFRILSALRDGPEFDALPVAQKPCRNLWRWCLVAGAGVAVAVALWIHFATMGPPVRPLGPAARPALAVNAPERQGDDTVGIESVPGTSAQPAFEEGPARGQAWASIASDVAWLPFGELALAPGTRLRVDASDGSSDAEAANAITVAVLDGVVSRRQTGEIIRSGGVLRLRGRSDDVYIARENADVPLRQPAGPRASRSLEREAVANPPELGLESAIPGRPDLIAYPGFEVALAGIEWSGAGSRLTELASLYVRYSTAVASGSSLPVDLGARIDEINGQLIQQTSVILRSGLPGMTRNAIATHPILAAHWILVGLDALGMPATETQERALAETARWHAADDEQRRLVTPPGISAVAALEAELKLRDRFFAAVDELLDARRVAALKSPTPPELADRLGVNLFSTDFAWLDWTRSVVASDRRQVARMITADIGGRIAIKDDQFESCRAVIGEWVGQHSEQWWQMAMTDLDLHGRYLKARVQYAVRRQVELLGAIRRRVRLTPEQAKAVLGLRVVYVPLRAG